MLRRLWVAAGADGRPTIRRHAWVVSPGDALCLGLLALVTQVASISAFDCGWPCTDTKALIARAGSPSTFEHLTRDDAYRAWGHELNARYAGAGLLSITAGAFHIPVGLAAGRAIRRITSAQEAQVAARFSDTVTDEQPTPSNTRSLAPSARKELNCGMCGSLSSASSRVRLNWESKRLFVPPPSR